MNTEHTPGPWAVTTVPIESRGGSNTCHKIGPMVACIYDDWRARQDGISEEENKANARLMAAAPELLAALERLENGVIFWMTAPVEPEDLVAARAAIIKAKGTK